jgi:hypothetical protein
MKPLPRNNGIPPELFRDTGAKSTERACPATIPGVEGWQGVAVPRAHEYPRRAWDSDAGTNSFGCNDVLRFRIMTLDASGSPR